MGQRWLFGEPDETKAEQAITWTPGRLGKFRENVVGMWFSQRGFYVYPTESHDSPCDLIVLQRHAGLLKIEVKGHQTNGQTRVAYCNFGGGATGRSHVENRARYDFDVAVSVGSDMSMGWWENIGPNNKLARIENIEHWLRFKGFDPTPMPDWGD